jgi:hypothetical protein
MLSIDALTLTALARAAGIAALALWAASFVRDHLRGVESRRARRAAWALTLTPWLTPALLTGYAYMPMALALVRSPGWKEALYDFALWARLTPLAVCALYFSPPPLTAQARHCHRLTRRQTGWLVRVGFAVRGAGRGPWAAFAAVFLLAFGEFELASLWGVKTWTVALFDAQAGGLPLGESLALARWPLGCASGAMLAAMAGLWRRDWLGASQNHRPVAATRRGMRPRLVWGALASVAILAAGWPLARLLPGAWRGCSALAGNAALGRDIFFSLLLAGSAAAAAWLAAGEGIRRPFIGGLSALPGMLGALLLSLLALGIFQLPGLRVVYGTLVPVWAALTLLLLPMTLLLRVLLRLTRPSAAVHLARLLKDRRLCWELDGHKHFWAGFLVLCWAYFDLTAASLLAPPGLTAVSVRLYNLMHYGASDALSAMLCATVAAPPLTALACLAAMRAFVFFSRRTLRKPSLPAHAAF